MTIPAANPQDINEARTLASVARRATTLWQDGYRLRGGDGGVYFVHTPEGGCYAVCCGPSVGYSCACAFFLKKATCKHLLAVDALVNAEKEEDERWEALAAEYDARQPDLDFFLYDDTRHLGIGEFPTAVMAHIEYDRVEEALNFCNGRYDF